MFRKTLFWLHLSAGVVAGIAIFIMSLTGVLLAFERQIKGWAAASHYPVHEQGATLLTLEQLVAVQHERQPDVQASQLVLSSKPSEPVSFRAGRRGGLDLDPYTGAQVDTATPGVDGFFRTVENFHRWLNVEGEHRDTARAIMDGANGVFLFILISGCYLWLPPMLKRAQLKLRVWFRRSYPSDKIRDYHWHHIFGIWMVLPLLVVVYTGAVMTYPWAANLLYTAFGAEIPAAQAGPGGPPPGAGRPAGAGVGGPGGDRGELREQGPRPTVVDAATDVPAATWLPLDALVQAAVADPDSAGWNHLTVTLPQATAKTVQIDIDQGNGAQAQLRHTVTVDRQSGAITGRRGFADQPLAQRLRGIARFLHTGEILGFWGQLVAALASFGAMMLVWTGLSLAWRRLIQPLLQPLLQADRAS
ncbi:MAG TPA: PepSY-associated TM helix domain-containing protein [Candidatus Acidoferrum sp.]|nr:PepSY-associated TM helix domain-containing protein [Candidatus Acidoferrum sp.]